MSVVIQLSDIVGFTRPKVLKNVAHRGTSQCVFSESRFPDKTLTPVVYMTVNDSIVLCRISVKITRLNKS